METKPVYNNALSLVFVRNEFYKKKFHFVLGIFVLNLLGVIALSCMLIYLIKNPPHPIYFVADPVGRLIQDIPVSEPNMSLEEVSAWTVEAVQSAYTYDYMNYRSQLQSAQKYFTLGGWRSYMNNLTKSNNLVALTTRSLIQMGAVVRPPQLLIQGHMGSVYAYKFQLQVLMTYWYPPYNDKSKIYNPLLVTVIVQRRGLLESYKGLAVGQMNAELVTTSAPQEMAPQ